MSMFCNQCQETVGNVGCKTVGVCGKQADTANLQDSLIDSITEIAVGLKAKKEFNVKYYEFILLSLFITITNANFDDMKIQEMIDQGLIMKHDLGLPSVANIIEKSEDEDVTSLKQLLLYGLKGLAAYVYHAFVLGKKDESIYFFAIDALVAIKESDSQEELLALVLKEGEISVAAMALLDAANTEKYGNPEVTKVNLGVRNNPGILVSGHDLLDLEVLLEQTKGTGVDVYTHSEMLPANYYPFFKKYDNLVGNYGNAWHQQNTEFETFNGPILMTTNCITPPRDSYKDRIFTTGAVGYEGVKHISEGKDFSEIIELAKICDSPQEIEQGEIVGGFGHHQVIALADKVVAAVKSGAIKRFIVMAGCDGRNKSRNYFTEVAENLPDDTIILTAGCAKYRYNKLELGDIEGIPRILDAGQCNDSYSLAVIALKLQEVFELENINDLPISFDIAWYEQKAVTVLLALLHLGFKGMRIGPTLPGFLSLNVAKILIDNFNLKPIGGVEEDIAAMMTGN
ncbi:MAG: hydroxylamine reductase [bacterium]|nr:hydroxylamine reductase [bacterium]